MSNVLQRRTRRMLAVRYDELRERYLGQRGNVDQLIRDPEKFTTTTRACFAAALAALEAALGDGVISCHDHVWLLQAHTAIVSHAVDVYSECNAGFEAEISHPLGGGAKPCDVEAYLDAAISARAELASNSDDIVASYDWAARRHDALTSPYRITTAATLHWARRQRGLTRRTVDRLAVYLHAMSILLEIEEFDLLDSARFLAQCLHVADDHEAVILPSQAEDTLGQDETNQRNLNSCPCPRF